MTMRADQYPNKITGIDFSGSKVAGRKIWITEGIVENHMIRLLKCFQAKNLPNSGTQLEICLAAIVEYIKIQRLCIIGIDFPFSIPEDLIAQDTWEGFIIDFPETYSNPDYFRNHCRQTLGQPERKRQTESENMAPLASYNLRIYKQTYYGIKNILHPVVKNELGYILPMQQIQGNKPWIVEICPRSTLINLGLNLPYKGNDIINKRNRELILKEVVKLRLIQNLNEDIRDLAVYDTEGDCLDSIIAAAAVLRSINNPEFMTLGKEREYLKEGYIYV